MGSSRSRSTSTSRNKLPARPDRNGIAGDADAELFDRILPGDETFDGEGHAEHEQQAEQDPLLALLVIDGAHQRQIEEHHEGRGGDNADPGCQHDR